MTSRPTRGGNILRLVAIVLMALTVTFNLMGGIGTSCVALNPTGWSPNMALLAPYQWLYILLMIGATALAIWGIVVTVALARGKPHAYRDALIVLVLSALAAGVQTFVSQALRGRGAPQNLRFYLTVLTLVVFLLYRLPPIWKRTGGFGRETGGGTPTAAGAAAFVGGLAALVTPLWAGPSHVTPDDLNWIDGLRVPLLAAGALLALVGIALLRMAVPMPAPHAERDVLLHRRT